MSALSLASPFPIFTDIDGNPLEDGYIYIGTAGLNPETNPISAYWDATLTVPAAQPIRTLGGYPSRNGTAARIYVNADDCSTLVKNKNGSLIFSALNQTAFLSSTMISFTQNGSTSSRSVQDKLSETISITDFGAVSGGSATTNTSAINAALLAGAGKSVYVPSGNYAINGPLTIYPGTEFYGDGYYSVIESALNIEYLVSSNLDTEAFFGGNYHDLRFLDSRPIDGHVVTNYHIHLRNPSEIHLYNIWTYAALSDVGNIPTNRSGVWFEKAATYVGGTYINHVHHCFIQQGGLLIEGVTDGTVTNNFIYGHSTEHSLKFINTGNYSITDNNLSSVAGAGAIWFEGQNCLDFRISGNFFDGLVEALYKGHGIYSPDSVGRVIVQNNQFQHQLSGIWQQNGYYWAITGNDFEDCNNQDPGALAGPWSDIVFKSVGLPVQTNIVSGNTFHQSASRGATPGFAIEEIIGAGGGFANNIYTDNTVNTAAGGYAANATFGYAKLNVTSNKIDNNVGFTNYIKLLGNVGVQVAIGSYVAANGSLDINIVEAASGLVGLLCVSSTRFDYAPQSRKQIWQVMTNSTSAASLTLLSGASNDGSGGYAAFTVSCLSPGIIRVTDTSGQATVIHMSFYGSTSFG